MGTDVTWPTDSIHSNVNGLGLRPFGLPPVLGTKTWIQGAVPRAGHLVEEQAQRIGEVRGITVAFSNGECQPNFFLHIE